MTSRRNRTFAALTLGLFMAGAVYPAMAAGVKKQTPPAAKKTKAANTSAAAETPPATATSSGETKRDLGKYQTIADTNIFGYLQTSAPTIAQPESFVQTPPDALPSPVSAPMIAEPDPAVLLRQRLAVTGIMSIGENGRRAILKDTGGNEGFYLGVGGEAMGASVAEIGKDYVVMKTESGDVTLYLSNRKPSSRLVPYVSATDQNNETGEKPDIASFPQKARSGGR